MKMLRWGSGIAGKVANEFRPDHQPRRRWCCLKLALIEILLRSARPDYFVKNLLEKRLFCRLSPYFKCSASDQLTNARTVAPVPPECR